MGPIAVPPDFNGNLVIDFAGDLANSLVDIGDSWQIVQPGVLPVVGVPLEQVAVLGDQANDLPMLRRAGLPIVMANAPDAVREQILVHTRSNADDGVAYAIDNLIMPRIGVPS